MIDALLIAQSGLGAHQHMLDVVANNLANVSTPAFKKDRVIFEDLVGRVIDSRSLGAMSPWASVGMGTHVASVRTDHSAAEPQQTGQPLDVAISGAGFFEFLLPGGQAVYSRLGALKVNEFGQLTHESGYSLSASLNVAPDVEELRLTESGELLGRYSGETEMHSIGQLDLALFANPQGLESLGQGLYLASGSSGEASFARPGEGGAGHLLQGYLEASNVNMVEELVSLVSAQRAYQLNARLLQAADEVLATINDLRQ